MSPVLFLYFKYRSGVLETARSCWAIMQFSLDKGSSSAAVSLASLTITFQIV